MNETTTIIILLLLVATLAKQMHRMAYSEHLTNRPSGQQKEQMINQVLKAKSIFTNKGTEMPDARHIIPWMDAIVYEDLRLLVRENRFNRQNISRVLS